MPNAPFHTARPVNQKTFLASLLSVTAFVALASGCPDPAATYEDFGARYDEIHPPTTSGGTGGNLPCTLPAEGELDGKYMKGLSAKLSPPKAFALDMTMTTTADPGGGLVVDVVLQPLSAMDQTTPVGDPFVLEDLLVAADGSFTWDLGTVTLIGAANPITGADIESTLILSGEMCGGERAGFICGDVSGIVTKPLNNYDLTGSTFAMERYDTALPAPLINCAKDPAEY